MLKITNILNPLIGGKSTTEYNWESGKPLSEYIGYEGDCLVTNNGIPIDLPLSKIFPAKTDEYTIMPILEGVDKQTQRILGYMAMTGVSFIPGWGPQAAWIGSNLINLFLKDKDPKDPALSQSYAWQHKSSPNAYMGTAMPVIYGKARVRPTLKNRYITIKGDKQYLYALYGIAAHKVDEAGLPTVKTYTADTDYVYGDIVKGNPDYDNYEPGKTYRALATLIHTSDEEVNAFDTFFNTWGVWRGTASFYNDIIINGRSITDYNKDVEWETRPGLPEQSIIIGFDATFSNLAQNKVIYLDYPSIVKDSADFRYKSTYFVEWDQHNLLLNGETYIIQAGKLLFTPGTWYIAYNPSVADDTYQLVADVPPPVSLIYTMVGFLGIIQGLRDLTYYYNVRLPIATDWYSPVITITNTHNIELIFEFPNGLYGIKLGNNIVSATCRLFAQYRTVDTSTTPTTYGEWLDFNFSFSDPDYVNTNTDPISGAVVRKKPEVFNISIKAVDKDVELLEYGKSYEVRVAASSPSIVKLVNIAPIVYGEENADGSSPGFTYPGEPLLGIKALASGQISGDLDVQVDVKRTKVWAYNTHFGEWVKKEADNHAWAVYDILANGHPDHKAYPRVGNENAEASYGCGIDKDRLDYDSFATWAANIYNLKYELNIVFDTFMTAWDAILRICQEGRGMIYPVGTKINAFTDKATDVTQVFTMGNIYLNTFAQKYMESSQKINMVEVTYYDKERNYEKTMIAARTADWDSSDGLSVPTTITLYGTTNFTQAWSIARFILMGNELLNNIISFGVDIDSLAAQAGDVVEVQHDVLTEGSGGRIIGVQNNGLLNGSFEDGLTDWDKWGNQSWFSDGAQSKYGTLSLRSLSTVHNAGGAQIFTVKPNKEYTLSAWIYIQDDALGTSTIRAMTYDGSLYYSAYANQAILAQWQRVSVTFTTASDQTEATVWLGGIGEAYFDGVMMNEGTTAYDFMMGTVLTLDRTVTIASGTTYQLEISHKNGTIETKNVTGGSDTDTLIWGDGDTTWSFVPEIYSPYSFGISGTHVKKYRIAEISRTDELMRTLTLIQYDEALYDSYTPNDTGPAFEEGLVVSEKVAVSSEGTEKIANILNLADNVQLKEEITWNDRTGRLQSSIIVTWDPIFGDPHGAWEVWFRDVDVSDIDWKGTWAATLAAIGYTIGDKVELDGATYISLADNNTTQPIDI